MAKQEYNPPPYSVNPDISVVYEMPFKSDILVPGDKFKIANSTRVFEFIMYATNNKLNKSWVDCRDVETRELRSFYPENIKRVVRPKKVKSGGSTTSKKNG